MHRPPAARTAARLGLAALLAALCAPASAAKPAPLALAPSSATVSAGAQVAFQASGGAGGYEYTLSVNASGGAIDPATGQYSAGATAGTDTVTVTDDAGKTTTAQVKVQATAEGAPTPGADDLGGHR